MIFYSFILAQKRIVWISVPVQQQKTRRERKQKNKKV